MQNNKTKLNTTKTNKLIKQIQTRTNESQTEHKIRQPKQQKQKTILC